MKRLLLINYHYVQDPARYKHPGIHPISGAALTAQLRKLGASLKTATPEEVVDYAAGDQSGAAGGFFCTFDDGLKDHIRTAPAILEAEGVRAVFFVSSRPLVEGRAISVHKTQWLRSQTPPEAFEAEFTARLPESWIRTITDEENTAAATQTSRYDPPEIARLKFAMNFLLPYDIVDRVTSEMLAARDIDEAAFCREFYMNKDEIRALAKAGHVIGCHGHTHRPFSKLGEAALDAEIAQCLDTLRPLAGPVSWLSYPWGSQWALPADPEALSRRHGFDLAITLKRDWNEGPPSRYRLNRINTNEVDAFLDAIPQRKVAHR